MNSGFNWRVSVYASCCGARTIHGFTRRWIDDSRRGKPTKDLFPSLNSMILTAVTNEDQTYTHAWLRKNKFKIIKKQKSGTTGHMLSFWFRAPLRAFGEW